MYLPVYKHCPNDDKQWYFIFCLPCPEYEWNTEGAHDDGESLREIPMPGVCTIERPASTEHVKQKEVILYTCPLSVKHPV